MPTNIKNVPQPTGITSPDIERLLHDAYLSSVRQTDEYLLGRYEEKLDAENEFLKDCFEKAVRVADIFFEQTKKIFSDLIIKQFRIGFDYSSRLPAVLMIISEKDRAKIKDIRQFARLLELISWSQGFAKCYLWTKTEKNIEHELVESDFPYFRKEI